MKLDIDRQEWGRSEIEISGDLRLEMGDGHPGSVQVEGSLTVDNLENRFLLKGKLKATGDTQCGRCLEAFTFVWDVPVEIMVLRNQDSKEGHDDTLVLHQSRGEVDLREALVECVVLACPLSAVCRDDCQGICLSCGIDKNKQSCDCKDEDYDPRWAALDDI
jgi:DUF177 domain-containing protein